MIDRSDQVWEFSEHDRFVVAYIHAPIDRGGHSVTVFYTSDERIWETGAIRWAESESDPWENDERFRRLL